MIQIVSIILLSLGYVNNYTAEGAVFRGVFHRRRPGAKKSLTGPKTPEFCVDLYGFLRKNLI